MHSNTEPHPSNSLLRVDLRFARVCIFLTLFATLAFRAAEAVRPVQAAETVSLELVQTVPVETELGLPGLRDAADVWVEMLDGARERVNLLHFYAVERGGETVEARASGPPTRLTPVIGAVERAAERGVSVRFLADRGFHRTYPELLDRLGALEGIEVRLIDQRAINDGVQHAKAMTVDGRMGFVGSQNFDWRALEHIQELGVRFTGNALTAPFDALFEHDWAQAASDGPLVIEPRSFATAFPLETDDGGRVTPVMSPRELLVDGELWDLPRLLTLIDGAKRDVSLQFLSYKPKRGREPWSDLDDALERAAARGVRVQLLLSHWSTRASSLDALRRLHGIEGLEVRFLTVPEHASGFIPFARVAHAKLCVVDGGAAGWVGTSNASGDYFHQSRNLGLIVEGGQTPMTLARWFAVGWNSPHTQALDPERDYPEPRVAE